MFKGLNLLGFALLALGQPAAFVSSCALLANGCALSPMLMVNVGVPQEAEDGLRKRVWAVHRLVGPTVGQRMILVV